VLPAQDSSPPRHVQTTRATSHVDDIVDVPTVRAGVVQLHPTGEQRACEPCLATGRMQLGVQRGPGLVACLRCYQEHMAAGLWPSADRPHELAACRLCAPAVTPPEDAPGAVGSLLPLDVGPVPANRPTSGNPWAAVAVVEQLAAEFAASGRRKRPGHDIAAPEVAVATVYAELTALYGPVVRPSVAELCARAGYVERTVQYALRALQRAGVLSQHANGAILPGDDGELVRYAAEYELRIPLARMDRGDVLDELDQVVNRARLARYIQACEIVRQRPAQGGFRSRPAARSATVPDALNAPDDGGVTHVTHGAVDNSCTPSGFLSSVEKEGSDSLQETTLLSDSLKSERAAASLRRGFALARKLQQRSDSRWAKCPLPTLAAVLAPLADAGWSAWRVDRATATYGPVTSASGLLRTAEHVAAQLRNAPQNRLAAAVAAVTHADWAAAAVSRADLPAVDHALTELQRRIRDRRAERPAVRPGWAALVQATGSTAPEPAPAATDVVDQARPVDPEAQRRAAIHARAWARAAAERATRHHPA
jgi:hypothetical protein